MTSVYKLEPIFDDPRFAHFDFDQDPHLLPRCRPSHAGDSAWLQSIDWPNAVVLDKYYGSRFEKKTRKVREIIK